MVSERVEYTPDQSGPPDHETAELGEGEETKVKGAIGVAGLAANAGVPPLIICAGEGGSGSTWLFNVAAEILSRSSPETRVIRKYLDENSLEEEFADQDGIFIVKTHTPPPWVLAFANLVRAPILLSVRDPRDATASLMTRFDENFEYVLESISSASRALAPLQGRPNVLLLRYEDQFTQKIETLETISTHLGARLNESDRDDIFARHTPDAVSETILALASKGAFKDLPARHTWDEETQWHPSHVGDGRVGKWRDVLTDAQAASVNYATRIFRSRFGYETTVPPVASGTTLDFSTVGSGAYYLDKGFSEIEAGGIWTTAAKATVKIRLTRPISRSLHISIKFSLSPTLLMDLPEAKVDVFVNDRQLASVAASSSNASQFLLSAWLEDHYSTGSNITIRFDHTGMMSPSKLGLGGDTRPLGIFLSTVHLEYF